MKCFVFFIITWALVASFPLDKHAQDDDQGKDKGPETRLNDPQYYGGGMSFGNTGGNVGQQGTNSGNVAVGHQFNLGYGRRETRLNDPQYLPYTPYIPYIGKRQMTFGATGGNVGQQGTNSGNVAVGHQWNGRRELEARSLYLPEPYIPEIPEPYIPEIPEPYIPYYKRQMTFGATAGNVGQQGTNSGNVAVGHQLNGRK